ncbi:MAG: winged helix-turn-helix domain-containing protein [Muribaculaceae bacterium]|nr:winged helix-turn-helix domain-containing protein [Muribaculaceae bacterium]
MNVETIGLWAGAVWTALNDANGSLELKGLKKATKLKEKEIFAALGWLAREGKVAVESDEAEKVVDVKLL